MAQIPDGVLWAIALSAGTLVMSWGIWITKSILRLQLAREFLNGYQGAMKAHKDSLKQARQETKAKEASALNARRAKRRGA